LRDDYRGIIVTMIHKFRDMPANLNRRSNIYVLIDEAHRTTGGDLGNFLMAGLPNATFIGFTGTPVDKTAATALARQRAAEQVAAEDQGRSVEIAYSGPS
jgi:type I site-specific restriction-modification system R (restriction) subunit